MKSGELKDEKNQQQGQQDQLNDLNNSSITQTTQINQQLIEKKKKKKQNNNTVCCFKISKNNTIKKQMIISLLILSFAVLILVIAIVVGNLYLTQFLIQQSSEVAIQEQIQENLHNSATEYSSAILEIFTGYSSTLEILNRIVLSAMKKDNSLYDYNYIKEFPIKGKGPLENNEGRYYNIQYNQDEIPDQLTKSYLTKQDDYPGAKFTYDKWNYATFGTENKVDVSEESQKYLEACDILNYFLEDFFFDKRVTHINAIYFAFEGDDELFLLYPGGIFEGPINEYSPQNSEWYKKTKKAVINDMSLSKEMIVTGPYVEIHEDESRNVKIITVSRAIVDKDDNFLGVASIDIKVDDIQDIIEKVKFYKTGFLSLVSLETRKLLNNPYNQLEAYKIDDEDITGLNDDIIEKIFDQSIQQDEILEGIDTKNEDREILVVRNFISTSVKNQNYVLIVQVPKEEAYQFLNDLNDLMGDTFQEIQIITIIMISATCFIAIVSGSLYSNRIVQPLTQLTEYAKSINSNATKKSFTQNIQIDLDSIKASDKIGELIEAFKSLVKGLSGLKKGARTEISAGNEKIQFPKNYFQGQKMPWSDLADLVENENNPIIQEIKDEYGIDLVQFEKDVIEAQIKESQKQDQLQNNNIENSQMGSNNNMQ